MTTLDMTLDLVLVFVFPLKERNMLVAEQFIQRLATEYSKHPVRTDGSGIWYPFTGL